MCAWITLGWQFLYDVENVEWHTACAQSTNIPPAIPTDTERENPLKWRMRITYRIEKANIYYILVCLLGFWGPCRASTLVARALAVVVPASRQDNLMFNIIFSETMRRQKKKLGCECGAQSAVVGSSLTTSSIPRSRQTIIKQQLKSQQTNI